MANQTSIHRVFEDRPSIVRANGRPTDIVAFQQAAVVFFLQTAELLGVPKSVAAIYGLFFATPRPLCFAEVKDMLDISIGSVSQGLRILREVGALKEVAIAGDRREYFVPDLELRKLIHRWLDQRLSTQLDAGNGRLAALLLMLPNVPADQAKELRSRLEQLSSWHAKARAVLPIAKTFLALSG